MKDKRWDFVHWLISFFSTSVTFQILCLVALSDGRQNGNLKARRGVLPGPLCSRTSWVWRWPLPLVTSALKCQSPCSSLAGAQCLCTELVTLPKTKVGSAAGKFCSISELLGKTVLQPSFPSNLHFCMKIKSVFKDSLEDQFRVQFWLN